MKHSRAAETSAARIGGHLAIVSIGCQTFAIAQRKERASREQRHASASLQRARDAGALIFHLQLMSLPATQSASWAAMQDEEPAFRFPEMGSVRAKFLPACAPRETEIVIECFRPSAFLDTRLPLLLRSNAVTDVVLVGLAALPSILASAVSAACMDFRVSVLVNTPNDDSSALERAAFSALQPWATILTNSGFSEALEDSSDHQLR